VIPTITRRFLPGEPGRKSAELSEQQHDPEDLDQFLQQGVLSDDLTSEKVMDMDNGIKEVTRKYHEALRNPEYTTRLSNVYAKLSIASKI
jgi:hypothetical protein